MAAIDWQVKTVSHLPSTQDAARDLAAEGASEGVVVQALMQTSGRGRHGNQWISPLGNLYISVLLRPACTAALAGQISFVAAVALSAAIDEVIAPGHVKTLKWPNDVVINGRKCAGLLLESGIGKGGMLDWLVIGIGVNVLAPPEDRIGLKDVWREPIAIHPFRDKVLEKLAVFYGQWLENGFSAIRDAWTAQAQGLGQAAQIRLPDRALEGIFSGIDADGALLLKMPDGDSMVINAGEVYFGV